VSKKIRERIRFGIGASASSSTSGYIDPLNAYDYAIGGIPFLSGISRDTPATIKSADFRKNQIDQSVEPGEQSLTGWWVRSQLSFHGGAGLLFSDPSLDESAPIRFKSSEGVDVWTQGEVTLLPKVDIVRAQASAYPSLLVGGNIAGHSAVVYGNEQTAGYVLDDGTDFAVTPAGAPTAKWQAMASDGGCYYFACTEGVWKLTFTSLVAYTFIKLWTIGSGTHVTIGWAKGRLMLGVDAVIYELIDPGGGTPHALPAAVFTSPAVDWRWSSFAFGPEAIYASGYSGNRGTIMRILVDEQGALPVLTGATEVAQLPTGEYPLCIRSYLGTKMGIGTSLGFRVAEIDSGGGLAYGPIISSDGPVYDMVGQDRFIYYTDSSTGNSGLVRVDLSVLNPSGRYAYATDLKLTGEATVDSVAIIGQTARVAFGAGAVGIHFQNETDLVNSGHLLTAQTRYNTLWPKLFKRLSVRARILGHLVVTTVDKNANEVTVATLDDNSDLGPDLSINAPDSPQESLGLRFVLEQLDADTGPTFRGYQFKALPGGPRQYSYLLPLLCFDSEKDGQGGVMGYKGYGSERLTAIMDLASEGTVVLFEDLGDQFSVLVTIEEIEFNQISPGGMTQSPWGGILTLNMRTLG
jgi:hypothetical protein